MANTSEGSGKLKKAESTQDILDAALNRRQNTKGSRSTDSKTTHRSDASKFASIESNTFYKVVFAEGEPETKKEQIAKLLTYDLAADKAENRERLQEFETLKEWLMEQRKDMAQEIINLTDTDAFSELKDVFDELNQGLIDFEDQMRPLTEILDAVYKLRMASDGAMFDVFKEIQDDKAEEERIAKLRAEQEEQLKQLSKDVEDINVNINYLQQQKSWFGLGGIKKPAQRAIAMRQVELEKKGQAVSQLKVEIANTKFERDSAFADFAKEKAKLRELLDISSDEHKARQQSLIDSANGFVDVADSRTGNVLNHLEGINTQIDRLGDSNGGLRNVYAIVSEAVEEAEESNSSARESLTQVTEDESNIAKMRRENSKMEIEEHITALTSAKVDTAGTFADLTAESYRIKAMKDANDSQVSKTRSLNSKGVSGVASRLSTVLQGVSMAALTESSEVAHMTLNRMNDQTNLIAQQEALKNAMGISQENDSLVKAIQELESYGKVARAATDISREGYEEMKANLAELEKTAKDVGEAVKEAVAVGAEVMNAKADDAPDSSEDSAQDSPKDDNPFSKLNI